MARVGQMLHVEMKEFKKMEKNVFFTSLPTPFIQLLKLPPGAFCRVSHFQVTVQSCFIVYHKPSIARRVKRLSLQIRFINYK